MNNITIYEYWDAELRTQSKKRKSLLEQAIFQTGAIITDRYEDEFFKDPKLLWRNPLLLKVKLPRGKRWEFILASKTETETETTTRTETETETKKFGKDRE